MRRRRMAVLGLVLAVVVAGLVGLAWMSGLPTPDTDGEVLKTFSLFVNGSSRGRISVLVPPNGTFTNGHAVRVSEEVFVTVKGSNVVHRLDGLSVEGNLIRAHYTWGVNESDMGHVYDMTLNVTKLTIEVTHCF
jgi:hypothetical protein